MCDARMDLVSGGGSISMMGVLARGVRSGGRRTVGVIPRALLEWEVCDHDADELLVTDDMRSRKGLMDARSDAFLALPGGLGTLEELLEAWVGRILGMHRKPVVVLDPWGDLAPLRRMVDAMTAAGLVRPGAAGDVRWTVDISEAFEFIETAWAAGEGRTASLPKIPTGHPSEWLESD
jgi:uncharacterized protein (TIGR00730 family)